MVNERESEFYVPPSISKIGTDAKQKENFEMSEKSLWNTDEETLNTQKLMQSDLNELYTGYHI